MNKLKQVIQHFFVYSLRFTLTSTNKKQIFSEKVICLQFIDQLQQVLKIKEGIASTLRDKIQENNVYSPFPLSQQEMLYFAIDKADLKIDTPDDKNQLHGTVIMTYHNETNKKRGV